MEKNVLIIDSGTFSTKCGYVGEISPRLVFPSNISKSNGKEVLVGNDIDSDRTTSRRFSKTKPVFEKGVVKNWDHYEDYLDYIFSSMKLLPKETEVLLTQKVRARYNDQEKKITTLFEKFEISSLLLQKSQILSLLASGRQTGLICDLGASESTIIPIYECYDLPHAMHVINWGGNDIKNLLSKILMKKKGIEITPKLQIHNDILEEILQNHCLYQSRNDRLRRSHYYHHHQSKNNVIQYQLPCGNILKLDEEILSEPIESYFSSFSIQPQLSKGLIGGIPSVINESILKLDHDIIDINFKNIVFSGGCSSFPNLLSNIESDLKRISGRSEVCVELADFENPDFSPFIGGSIIGGIEAIREVRYKFFCTLEEYNEVGTSLFRRRRF